MTQDCLNLPSAADVSQRLPKGIHIIETEKPSDSKVGDAHLSQPTDPAHDPTSWSYLFVQHMMVKTLQRWLDEHQSDSLIPPYFIHQSYRYTYKNADTQSGVRRTLHPTVSGLLFLQGTVPHLQSFLTIHFPQLHLVNNCSTHRPASIPDAIMQPFMNVIQAHPEKVTFLREPFEQFARHHVRLRVLTGPFAGYEGYIVRIDRDRQLVFDFAGHAVALRGVHKEDFMEVPE